MEISQGIPRCIAVKQEAADSGDHSVFTVTVADMMQPLPQDIVAFAALSTGVAGLIDKSNSYKKPVAAQVGGMDAAYYEVEASYEGDVLLEKMYSIYPGNFFVTVTFVSRAERDLPDIEQVIGGIKVNPQA